MFFKKNKIKDLKGVTPITAAIRDSVFSRVGTKSIPPMPGAAQKAFELSVNPKAEARDFIGLLESDEALAARIIKIANSVFYDRGRASQTIEESVVVIGINELKSLLNASTLSELFPSKSKARTFLWGHDIATGIAARVLADRINPKVRELSFLAGIMHDIGKLLLLQRSPDDYGRVFDEVELTGSDFVTAENEVFPFDHTQVGQLIAEKWNFSTDLVHVIRHHHDRWEDIPESYIVTGIVKASDIFVHSMGIAHPKGFSRFCKKREEDIPEALEALHLPTNSAAEITATIKRTYDMEADLFTPKS